MPDCYIALGANLGSAAETFRRACELLGQTPQIAVGSVSSNHRTAAVGESAGTQFLNAAAEIEADLPAIELLEVLESIERQLGRTRKGDRSPRTLDLDLLFYGNQVIDAPRLRVPHPACWYRRFVLDPLVEIAADFVHPEKGLTVRQLRDRLLQRPFTFALAGADLESRAKLIETLFEQFPDVVFSHWPRAIVPDEEPALIAWLGDGETRRPSDTCQHAAWLDATSVRASAKLSFLQDVLCSALGRD